MSSTTTESNDAGAHAYRDHASDRVIAPGEILPEAVAERIAESHPHDVEAIEGDELRDVVAWAERSRDDPRSTALKAIDAARE